MTYEEASEYMLGLNKRGIHPGLEGIRALCDVLGNPEKGLRYIHVVGTNGKGSTSLYISEMLRAAGYKCGLYTSPVVFCEREIISVNNRMISKKDYADITEILSKANTMGCTRFELETVMAFIFFKNKGCDIAVIEAGMGGELDATNIIPTPLASVFASIGIDHCAYLGNTIEEIANTKTGVIKPDSIVVSTVQDTKAETIIKEKAVSLNCEYIQADYREAVAVKFGFSGLSFSYKGLKGIRTSLLGTFQLKNACLAIDTVRAIASKGIKVSDNAIKKGMGSAKESGRFEKISDKPLFFIDGAHNEPASLMLRETINTYFTKKRFIYIMGMLRDKDAATVIENTADLAECIFTVATPNTARTFSAFELANEVRPFNSMVTAMDSIDEAVEMALMMAGTDKDVVILAFGSLSHLSAVKKAVENRKSIKKDTHGVV